MTTLNQIKFIRPGSVEFCDSAQVKQTHSVRTFVPSFLLRFHEFKPEHFIYSVPSQRFVSKGSHLFLSSPWPLICLRKSEFATVTVIWFKPCEMETAETINTTINTVFGLFVGSFCTDYDCVLLWNAVKGRHAGAALFHRILLFTHETCLFSLLWNAASSIYPLTSAHASHPSRKPNYFSVTHLHSFSVTYTHTFVRSPLSQWGERSKWLHHWGGGGEITIKLSGPFCSSSWTGPYTTGIVTEALGHKLYFLLSTWSAAGIHLVL